MKIDGATGEVLWYTRYASSAGVDEAVLAVAHDSQDNVFVTGRAMISGNGSDIITMKLLGSNGQIQWTRYISGSAALNDVGWAVAVGPDDDPVIAGYIVAENEEALCITCKLANSDGATIWERTEPGAVDNMEVRGNWLLALPGGDLVMGHRTFGANGYDVALFRYAAADGSTIWSTRYDGATHGGDDVRDIILDSQNNLLVAGVQDVNWNYNYMALKFDSADGALLWEAGYDGPVGWYDVANCISQAPGGPVVVSGLSDGSGTGWDWATVAFDADEGSQLWVQRFDGPASQSDEAKDIATTADGGIFVTGYGYGENSNMDFITIGYEIPGSSPAGGLPDARISTRAWPNPFNPRVNLSFDLPRDGFATLVVYDLRGRTVATLVRDELGAGIHRAAWDGRNDRGQTVAAGTYLAVVRSGDLRSTRKMVLAK